MPLRAQSDSRKTNGDPRRQGTHSAKQEQVRALSRAAGLRQPPPRARRAPRARRRLTSVPPLAQDVLSEASRQARGGGRGGRSPRTACRTALLSWIAPSLGSRPGQMMRTLRVVGGMGTGWRGPPKMGRGENTVKEPPREPSRRGHGGDPARAVATVVECHCRCRVPLSCVAAVVECHSVVFPALSSATHLRTTTQTPSAKAKFARFT